MIEGDDCDETHENIEVNDDVTSSAIKTEEGILEEEKHKREKTSGTSGTQPSIPLLQLVQQLLRNTSMQTLAQLQELDVVAKPSMTTSSATKEEFLSQEM